MTDSVVLDNACAAYRTTRDDLVRTPRHDVSLWRKSIARDEAEDRLVTLLIAHGRVHHHHGHAYWVDCGELHVARVETGHRASKGTSK